MCEQEPYFSDWHQVLMDRQDGKITPLDTDSQIRALYDTCHDLLTVIGGQAERIDALEKKIAEHDCYGLDE